MDQTIYKIVPRPLWDEANVSGRFDGAPIDVDDGYIHLSTGEQVRETASRHFQGEGDLLLVAVDAAKLGDALKYEPSRGGALFPHLYSPLDMGAVAWVEDLPLGPDGHHQFPASVR